VARFIRYNWFKFFRFEMKKTVDIIFWGLVGVFVFIVVQMFVPVVRNALKGSEIFLLSFAVFFLLGVWLLFQVRKDELIQGKRKLFLILAGGSSVGLLVFVVLHNLFYALGVYFENVEVMRYLLEALSVVSFILAIVGGPLAFLVGVIGTIVLMVRRLGELMNI